MASDRVLIAVLEPEARRSCRFEVVPDTTLQYRREKVIVLARESWLETPTASPQGDGDPGTEG